MAFNGRRRPEMKDKLLLDARRRAEEAVRDMREGPLKIAAFQTILNNLLTRPDASIAPASIKRPKAEVRGALLDRPATGRVGASLPARILTLKDEDYFKEQRTLPQVREALGARGWHYAITALSGAMQGLVRKRELRREKVSSGGKKIWKYSNP
jgi:hypothetical protein